MGYVVHRRDRWYAVGYEGIDPITGRDRRRWYRAANQDEANALAAGLPRSTSTPGCRGITVARFMQTRWLPLRAGLLRPTTLFRYERMTATYIVPHIGRVPLRRLRTTHLHDLYRHLLTAGSATGTPLAPKTVLNVHQILRTALSHADKEGLVERNVAAIISPSCSGVAPEQSCWNAEQLRAFLDVAIRHRLGPALSLAAMTGMRRGEVLGLRWSDLDPDDRAVVVRRSVSCTGYQTHTTPTKTRASRRTGELDDSTLAVLARWRERQQAELGVVGEGCWMFTRAGGQPVTRTLCPRPSNVSRQRPVSRGSGCTTSAIPTPPCC